MFKKLLMGASMTTLVCALGFPLVASSASGTDASPTVSSVSPSVVRTGPGKATVQVYGSGFTTNTAVRFFDPSDPSNTRQQLEVGVSGVTYDSPTQLTLTLGFSNWSERIAYDVQATNGQGEYDPICSGCFTLYRAGYWMLGSDGTVYNFGDAPFHGSATSAMASKLPSGVRAVSIVPTNNGDGYCVVDTQGTTYCYNAAGGYASLPPGSLRPGEQVTSMDVSSTSNGYWFFTSLGRVFPEGGAPFFGDLSGFHLTGPVLGSIITPTEKGYFMVASDGGVFAFGDAVFRGSMGGHRLDGPVVGLAPDPSNKGYWLVANDGGIFAFGDAPFRGSMGGIKLAKPVVGMVPYGNGYLMVAADGGIFDFAGKPFDGSLGNNPPRWPIDAVAVLTP